MASEARRATVVVTGESQRIHCPHSTAPTLPGPGSGAGATQPAAALPSETLSLPPPAHDHNPHTERRGRRSRQDLLKRYIILAAGHARPSRLEKGGQRAHPWLGLEAAAAYRKAPTTLMSAYDGKLGRCEGPIECPHNRRLPEFDDNSLRWFSNFTQ